MTVAVAQRRFGAFTATAIVVGESIGSGIFLTLSSMARSLGSPALLFAVWIAMGIMTLCGALCYAELAVRYPRDGGEYVYLQAGYGSTVAFLFGWMSVLVVFPGVAAAMAVGAGSYVATLLPGAHVFVRMLPALLLLAVAAATMAGTAFSGRVMSFITWSKVALLFALIACAALPGKGHLANLHPFAARLPGSAPLLGVIAAAAVGGFFSVSGWWDAAKIAGEVRDAKRVMPRAYVAGVLIVTAVYLLLSLAFLSVVPLGSISAGRAFIPQLGDALLGSTGSQVLTVCVLSCFLSALSALSIAAPRVSYAMALAGSFFRPFAKLQPRFGTPWNSVLLQTALAIVVLSLGAFDRMLSYITFILVFFLALTAGVLFREKTPVRAWWYPAAPVIFIAACAAIAILVLVHDPLPALLGTIIVLCGLPAEKWLRGHSTRAVPSPLPPAAT